MCVRVHAGTVTHMWRPEDGLQEAVFSFHVDTGPELWWSGLVSKAPFPAEPTSPPFYRAGQVLSPVKPKLLSFRRLPGLCSCLYSVFPPLPSGLRTFLTSVSSSLTKLSLLPVGPHPPARGPGLLVLFCQDHAGSTSPAFDTFSRPEFYPTCHIILTG